MLKYPKIILIIGEIKLKKQNGKYDNVEIPKIADCVAPQVFQGINTEVTVPLSSIVRLKFSGASLFFL